MLHLQGRRAASSLASCFSQFTHKSTTVFQVHLFNLSPSCSFLFWFCPFPSSPGFSQGLTFQLFLRFYFRLKFMSGHSSLICSQFTLSKCIYWFHIFHIFKRHFHIMIFAAAFIGIFKFLFSDECKVGGGAGPPSGGVGRGSRVERGRWERETRGRPAFARGAEESRQKWKSSRGWNGLWQSETFIRKLWQRNRWAQNWEWLWGRCFCKSCQRVSKEWLLWKQRIGKWCFQLCRPSRETRYGWTASSGEPIMILFATTNTHWQWYGQWTSKISHNKTFTDWKSLLFFFCMIIFSWCRWDSF